MLNNKKALTKTSVSAAILLLLLVSLLCGPLPEQSQSTSSSDEFSTTEFDSRSVDTIEQSREPSVEWDWESYADEEGYVGVILYSDGNTSVAADKHDTSPTSTKEFESWFLLDGQNSASPAIKRGFSKALNGVSAKVSLETLKHALLQESSLRIYPDIQVEAYAEGRNIEQVGADQLWALTDWAGNPVTGSGVVVAVIDTGVDYTHPDLGGGFGPGYKVIDGYDFVNNDGNPLDDNGHGTHVAGIVAASGGVVGAAPKASILAYKVLNQNGFGTMSNVIAGIEAAMDPDNDGDTSDHADIISLSLGGAGEPGDPLCLAVRSAVDSGIVVVVAAGNEGPSMGTVASPGLEPKAITVGAIDGNGILASFSSRGTSSESLLKPEISAPGVGITSTVPYSGASYSSPTGYRSMSGTSMATPHVSGVAALLLQLHPDWSPKQVKSAIITGSEVLGEPLWHAGAGGLWAPLAAEADLFLTDPRLSCLTPDGTSKSISITNGGTAVTYTLDTDDWQSALYNGSSSGRYWTNASSVSPSSLALLAGGNGIANVAVVAPEAPSPEGYYDGVLYLAGSGQTVRIPFGFVVLSHLNVHVLNKLGKEVSDPRGVVFVYSYPDASISLLSESTPSSPSPPASFRLPSGTYSVHALGHQLFYSFSDPYVLSGSASLGRMSTVDVYLSMVDAREFVLNLTTADGNPIYAKDFVLYCRYVGSKNVSALAVSSDSSIIGSELFSLTKSRHVYISDTDATVGISIAGFSYSVDMWDFMSMNWQNWYEFSGSSSTEFLIESTADLQYLISWELNGVDSTRPLTLGVDEARSSVFNTKYDILGTFDRIWGSGNHLSIGGDATPYARRDTYTSLNPFFSGMTRTTIVQGVYFEKYWPGSLSDVYVSPQYYVPDYSHRVKASDVADVYLADRIYLDPIEGIEESVRVGAGPFYPSVQTMNTGSSFVLLHPLLRDSGGARVATPETPWLYLYRDGSVVYSSKLDEYRGSPSPMRVVPISGGKSYQAIIPTWSLASRVSDTALITLSFSMNTTDINPPAVTSLAMPQRFIPGGSVTLELSAVDDVAVAGVTALWRSSGSSAWKTLTVQDLGAGKFRASIHTATTDAGIDLKFRVTDTTGNYLEYTTTHASLKQVPILFDLSIGPGDVSYVDGDVSIVVSGRLTDSNGSPLCPTNAVPIDLMLGDRKVGMLLDEHVEGSTHYHDGTIRYEWHFNPARLFTGSDQTIEITARADLGIYQPRSVTILLHSVKTGNSLPTIRLVSPTNGSLIPAGETIDLSVWDDGVCAAYAYLDGNLLGQLSSPWDVDTSVWAEGGHTLSIVATDDEGAVSRASYSFEVDAFAPSVEIIYPTNGSNVPVNSMINAEVYDSHLSSVSYSVDGLPGVALNAPYDIDTSSWSIGAHIVIIQAVDQVGKVASRSVSFVIVRGSVAIGIASPLDWNALHSGVSIVLSIVGNGVVTARWSDSGVWHDLGSDFTISTEGWSEGAHMIVINASNDLGEYDELRPVITIDDTPPSILLEFPGNNSFVDRSDEVRLAVHDVNLKSVAYTVWNHTVSNVLGSVVVPLTSSPGDGYFEIDVSSLDSAGNQRSAMFSFVMDSEAPSISIEGLTSGCALKPGFPLNITAFDMFLETVMFSLDAGFQASLTPPYSVDTSSFSNGWHLLQVVASDLSGKESRLNMSFYVDALSPAVKFSEVSSYTPNASLEVRASVSDDYGVAAVQLFYELRAGGYGSAMMAGYDGVYVAELAPDLLWKGMTIYVLATDKVGNVAESPHMTLQPATSPFDGNPTLPGSPSGWGAAMWAWIVSTNGLAVLGLIGVIALAGVVLYARRRREDESKVRTVKPKPSPRGVSNASPFAELPPPKPIIAASAKQIVASVKAAAKTVGQVQVPTRVPTAVASGSGAPARAMLLDSIPEITLKPDVKSPEDDIDYGELIERELNTSAWKNSAFGKGIGHSAVSREFDARPDRPGIISGLKLMKIME